MHNFNTIRLTNALILLAGLLFVIPTAQAQLNFEVGTISTTSGSIVDIPVTVTDFTDVAGITAQIQFPSNQATFISIEDANSALTSFDTSSYHDLGTGNVNVLWIEPNLTNVSISDGSLLFYIRLQIDAADGFEINLGNLLVSDNAANQIPATSTSGRITIDPLTLIVESLTTNPGATVDIPVTVANFKEVVGFQFTVKFPADKADFVSLENIHANLTGFASANYFSPTDGTINVLWDEASLSAIDLPDEEVLFNIRVQIEASAPDSFPVSLSNLVFYDDQIETITATSVEGEIKVVDLFDITGKVEREDGTPIALTDLVLSSSTGDVSFTTTTDGQFQFNDLTSANYELSPSKDINYTNGVDVADILLIRRHLLGITPLSSPYKLIAADADFSDEIDVADILSIRSLVLGSQTTLTHSWRFIDAAYVFNDPTNPFAETFSESILFTNPTTDQLDQDFVGLKVGDVNENNDANHRNMGDDLFLEIASEKIFEGSLVKIPVRTLSNYEDIAGWQGSLTFDPSVLTYEGIEGQGVAIGAQHIGMNQLAAGKLSFLYDSPTGLGQDIDDNSPLFYLLFRAVGTAGRTSDISFNSSIVPSKAYDGDLNSNFNLSVASGNVEVLGTTITIYPNPGRNFQVGLVLPTNELVQIQVFDVLGKQVYSYQKSHNQGGHFIELDANTLPAGTYIMKLQAGTQVHTEKLVVE